MGEKPSVICGCLNPEIQETASARIKFYDYFSEEKA
jgi:hypothetical protein